jgi:hypothetical protein
VKRVEATAVVVPVLGRVHRAVPFMASLTASTESAVAVAVCSADADVAAWAAAGARTVRVDDTRVSFPCKVNDAYRAIGDEFDWLFVTGDDVSFHPGWLERAQAVAAATEARVVAVNDLLNEAVMAGTHGTHVLVSTSYVRDVGASWDGPGLVCCEEYRHWYVDNEWSMVAQQRGVWAAALDAVVEHLHWTANKAKLDETYRVALDQATADRDIWARRAARFIGPPST